VIRRGSFILGEELERFEAEFGASCDGAHAVGVASGTDAITIALTAVGVQHGDEVITAANTCVPTVVGIEAAGAVPVLVDVDPATLTMDIGKVEAVITKRTPATVPVHLYGQCADLGPLVELARTCDLRLVEDCAQAHGATYGGRSAGVTGDAAAFSFYPTKNLGALGDAGAVVTTSSKVAAKVRLLRNYGERNRFEHVLRGRNSRLDELQAALLRVKLSHLNEWNERRRKLARTYDEAFANSRVEPPHEGPKRRHVYHLYVVRVDDRNAFRDRLSSRGVGSAVHYPTPIHRQPAYRDLDGSAGFPVAETASERIVSLPLYPEISDEEVAQVIDVVLGAACT